VRMEQTDQLAVLKSNRIRHEDQPWPSAVYRSGTAHGRFPRDKVMKLKRDACC
jgi:hypothetical protein